MKKITVDIVESGFIIELECNGKSEIHATGNEQNLMAIIRKLIHKEHPKEKATPKKREL